MTPEKERALIESVSIILGVMETFMEQGLFRFESTERDKGMVMLRDIRKLRETLEEE